MCTNKHNIVTRAELMKPKRLHWFSADIIELKLSGALFKMKPSHLPDVVSIIHGLHLCLHTYIQSHISWYCTWKMEIFCYFKLHEALMYFF